MSLRCKIFGHKKYYLDYLEFGSELQRCRICGISNYKIDDNYHLIKLGRYEYEESRK